MPLVIRETRALLKLAIIGALILALGFAAIGVWLVYLGATSDDTKITIFGQSIESRNTGILAIFIAAVLFVIIVRRVLKTVDLGIDTEAPPSPATTKPPIHQATFEDVKKYDPKWNVLIDLLGRPRPRAKRRFPISRWTQLAWLFVPIFLLFLIYLLTKS